MKDKPTASGAWTVPEKDGTWYQRWSTSQVACYTFIRTHIRTSPAQQGKHWEVSTKQILHFLGWDTWAMKQLLPPLAFGTHYNHIRSTRSLHCSPNQGQQCSTPQGIKSQLPHEPKASAWKRRRKAKLLFRVITEDSNRGLSGSCALVLSLPVCHVKSRNTKRIKINLITFKQNALNSFTWLYKEENHTLAWI